MSTLLRSATAASALRAGAASAVSRRAGLAGASFVRGKATLPDLSCMVVAHQNTFGGASANMNKTITEL